MPIDPRLIEILVCPACSGSLAVGPSEDTLDCRGCGRSYPVRDGIPVLLVDEATGTGSDGTAP